MLQETARPSLLGDHDLHLFNEGTHQRLWEKLGAHASADGTFFAVWAPDAARVSVVGDWNDWRPDADPLRVRGASGIWEGFLPGARRGALYKFHVVSRHGGVVGEKADPFALHAEVAPRTASVVWDLAYAWGDAAWLAARKERNAIGAPISIYEVHLGSWRRVAEQGNRSLSYRELAVELVNYVIEQGFTHVELMPVMEHPFFGSWGYQTTGYFAPSSRYGTPQDLMLLIDRLHQAGIGVILDWVPSHFAVDAHGLAAFDGSHLFEHGDPRQGFHPDWASYIFNYGRNEVKSFLLSSALFWLERYHADGLRVDGVASMLYLDYSRKAGEWIPNRHGGRENLGAVDFLRQLNAAVYAAHPDVQTYAEESTAWPMVSRPAYVGGLGFGLKWDMGWMHDTLRFLSRAAVHRKWHQNELTFRSLYAWSESYVLPLSHDEVVHGKSSLLGKMAGDDWQKLASLRLLLAYQWTSPGKKLLFMGGELGQWREWDHDGSLDWHLLEHARHRGVQRCLRDLNVLYRAEPALHELDCDAAGFEWIDCNDAEQSVLAWLRWGRRRDEALAIACNFTPVPRYGYQLGVPFGGRWLERFNSDAELYGGSGQGNQGGVAASAAPCHGRPCSIEVTLPPLAIVVFSGRA